jgi:hypothetical protein
MGGPRVTIKNNVGDGFVFDDSLERFNPITGIAAIGDLALGPEPERAIACIEANAPDICPRRAEHFAQTVEERPMGPLQKQERSGCVIGHSGPMILWRWFRRH